MPTITLLLVGILALLFVRILRESREQLEEIERGHRHTALQEATERLRGRLEKAQSLLRAVTERPSFRDLAVLANGGSPPLEAWQRMERLLEDLAREPRVWRLTIYPPDDGLPLLAAGGAPPTPPPLQLPALPGLASRAAGSPGSQVLDLAAPGRLRAATCQGVGLLGRGLVVLVELDVQAELEALALAAGGGSWEIRDETLEPAAVVGGNTAVARVKIGEAAESGTRPPPDGDGQRENTTVLRGEELSSLLRLSRPGWVIRVLLPVRVARQVMGELGWTLLLATAAVVLILVMGLGSSEARARLAYVQHTLEETERQERFLQGVFDAITDALVVVDTELKVVRANRIALQLHGRDLVGRSYEQALAARSPAHEEDVAGLRQVLASGQPRKAEARGAGDSVWELAQFAIFGPGGRVVGAVEYAVDVTQTRRLHAQLVQSDKLSTLGEMAAGIAHEINNPLGVVSMYAQLLAEELRESLGEDAAPMEKVKTIEEQTTHVGEIVRNLLRFARKSEGKRVLFELRSAVERALSIADHQREQRGIEQERLLELSPPARVLGDEAALSQVVLNLVVNARQAMGGRGHLRVELRRRGSADPAPEGRLFGEEPVGPARILLQVSDSGPGIEPQHLERLFEPFFTTKPVGEGTGLGLSVSFGIIRDHGGCIRVHSQPGAGTTFTIELPEATGEEAP